MSDILSSALARFHKYLLTYSDISLEEINLIKPIVEITSYLPGDYFIRPGESSQKVGFTLSGLTKAFFLSEEGEEIIIAFSEEGDVNGLYADILYGIPSTGFIQAIEETHILTTNYKLLMEATKNCLAWMHLHLAISQHLYRYMSDTQKNIDLKSAIERYSYFQKSYPQLIDRLPQNQIAKHLRIDSTTLSRIKNRTGKYK